MAARLSGTAKRGPCLASRPAGQRHEGGRTHEVDVGQGAAGERGEAEAQDRADIGLARVGHDAFFHGAGGLERLDHQEPLLQLGDVDRVRVEAGRLEVVQAGPQALRRALGIVVEALAVLAAEPALVLDQLDEQRLLRRVDGGGAELRPRWPWRS